MREMMIDSIRVSLTDYQRVVILRAKDTDRYLPIWIGPNEADAIAVKLQDMAVARPLTHDLLGSVIDKLGASVSSIVVSELTNDTFFAKIVLGVNGDSIEVDCRPSDAIALAVRSEAPIYAEESVLERASVQMDAETGQPKVSGEQTRTGPLREGELKSLSAFTDFVSSLDLDDIGEGDKGEPEKV